MRSDLQKRIDKAVDKEVAKIPPAPKTLLEAATLRKEERKYEKSAPTTGYLDIDYFLNGFVPGHLYALTGETNAGKSALALNFTYRVAKQGKKVTYFALEPDVTLVEYLASIHLQKRWSDITDDDLFLDLPGISVYTKESHESIDQLVNTIENMERQDLIIVDHIGYFTNNARDKRSQVQQESEAIKRIVGAAKKKKSAILIIAHPRKPIGGGKKEKVLTMNDISGSAAFKQDSTDIIILHRIKDDSDVYQLKNLPDGYLLFPKVKAGKSGSVKVYFVPDTAIMLAGREVMETQADEILEEEDPEESREQDEEQESWWSEGY